MISREELRLSNKSSEILSNLVRFSVKKGHGFIWQNNGQRTVFPVRIEHVELDSRTLVLSLYPEASISVNEKKCLDFNKIDHSGDIFFKGDERDILFKMTPGKYSTHGDKMFLSIPKSVFLKENRKAERFIPKEDLTLSVKPGFGGPTLNLGCKNFCEGGIGLTLSFNNAHLFRKGQRIFVERIGEIVLPKELVTEIVYIRKYHEERERKILMGIRYVSPLSQSLLTKLTTL